MQRSRKRLGGTQKNWLDRPVNLWCTVIYDIHSPYALEYHSYTTQVSSCGSPSNSGIFRQQVACALGEFPNCRGQGTLVQDAGAVPRAERILQPRGERCCSCHSHHEQQHLNEVCRSLFHRAFPRAQGQAKVPTPPVAVRDFPIASCCSDTYDFRLLFVFNSGISIDVVKNKHLHRVLHVTQRSNF